MPPPNDTKDQPKGVKLIPHSVGRLKPSPAQVTLLVAARSNYDWPRRTGAALSQQTIIDLENSVAECLAVLTADSAHKIVIDVYRWALPDNVPVPPDIVNATDTKQEMMKGISFFLHGQVVSALDVLCSIRYIALVIASKIYRFCKPQIGAAVDQHASLFFNTLPINNQGFASHFERENSKLVTFPHNNYIRNRDEYIKNYLPLLAKIANELNALPALYTCANSGANRPVIPE